MRRQIIQGKFKEWLWRYAQAELLGTCIALAFAWFTYGQTHSYAAAAGAGFVGEGIGFYGLFIVTELRRHGLRSKNMPFYKRLLWILTQSSRSLFVEFAPAEVLDSIIIRPFAMFIVPQYIKPYAAGFIIGKFGADLFFYVFAIAGYEAKKRWYRPK